MNRIILFLLNFSVFSWLAMTILLAIVAINVFTMGIPVDTAADVMGRIFPVYGWALSAFSAIFAIFIVYAEMRGLFKSGKIASSIKYLASGALIVNLAQSAYIFPESRALREVMKEARIKGDVDSILGVSEKFNTLHDLSTNLNVVTMVMALLLAVFFHLSLKHPE